MYLFRAIAATIVVFVLTSIRAGQAQPAPTSSPSLRQAITYARAHQPSLAAARARVEVARAAAEVPRAAFSPRVTGAAELLIGTSNNTTASYASVGILDIARIGGTPANASAKWAPEPSTLAGVAVHKELFDFGRLEAQAEAYDELVRAADESAKASELDVDLLVQESFYAVLGAKQVLAASDGAVTRARTHRDLAQARVTAQMWPPIELTRAEADVARFEVDRVRANGALASAQAVLAAAIGSTEAAIDAGIDDLTFGDPPPAIAATNAQQTPELRAARAQLAAQQKITRSIRDELLPDLSVSAELTGRAGGASVAANPSPFGDGWVPDVPNWDALVVFSWPIYDRTVTARAKTSQRAEVVRAAEIGELSERLRSLATRAFVNLDVARAALPALQHSIDAATANHEQTVARFGGGLATAVELSDAEVLLTDAQIQLAIGQFNLSLARARLARILVESSR
jgi:outer membrane protein